MVNSIKKIIPYLLILIVLVGVGFFSSTGDARADNHPDEPGTCIVTYNEGGGSTTIPSTRGECTTFKNTFGIRGAIFKAGGDGDAEIPNSPSQPATSAEKTPFENNLINACTINPKTWFSSCLLVLIYYTYFQLPAFALLLSALFFNAMISIGLSSITITSSGFIPDAWGVVRDLSNIFFILILLYVAIRMIVGLADHEVKQMIAKVMVLALLINFSMFFTKIVIDSSNILALVFYNKLDTSYKDSDGKKAVRPNTTSTPYNERDISGSMYQKFNPTKLIDEGTITALKQVKINGKVVEEKGDIPLSVKLGIMILAGTIMLFAAYTFFVAGFMFLGRLIELWILIIFSPFAFMSFAIPKLSKIPYVGWDEWSTRLVATSFMAPIFMFFMYFIFLLLDTDKFFDGFTSGDGAVAKILSILIPAMIILALLLKATKFAEKGGGQFGEIVAKGGKMLGGLAVTAVAATASGGTALALRATAGRAGAGIAASSKLKNAEAKGGLVGFGAARLRDFGKFSGAASFDVRGAKIGGKTLASATGMNLGEAKKGGFIKGREEQVAKRQKRAKELEVGEDEPLKQELNRYEEAKQNLLRNMSHDLEQLDNKIKGANEDASAKRMAAQSDPNNKDKQKEYTEAADKLIDLRKEKKALKNGESTYQRQRKLADGEQAEVKFHGNRTESSEENPVSFSLNELEDTYIPNAHHHLEEANNNRKWNYAASQESGGSKLAGFIFSGGTYTNKASRETGHSIRMGAKVKESSDHGKGGGQDKAHSTPTPKAAPAPKGDDKGSGGNKGGHH